MSEFGIEHGRCIDDTLIEKLTGSKLIIPRTKISVMNAAVLKALISACITPAA